MVGPDRLERSSRSPAEDRPPPADGSAAPAMPLHRGLGARLGSLPRRIMFGSRRTLGIGCSGTMVRYLVLQGSLQHLGAGLRPVGCRSSCARKCIILSRRLSCRRGAHHPASLRCSAVNSQGAVDGRYHVAPRSLCGHPARPHSWAICGHAYTFCLSHPCRTRSWRREQSTMSWRCRVGMMG